MAFDYKKEYKEFYLPKAVPGIITEHRFHHEIYLSDARRCAPEKLKTVIRLPIKKMGNF